MEIFRISIKHIMKKCQIVLSFIIKKSIEEIQSFVGEQKSSIEQINDLAQQLSQVVEQNASAEKIQGAYFTIEVCTLSICYGLISIRSRIICKSH